MIYLKLKDIIKSKTEKIIQFETELLLSEKEGIKKMNFLKNQSNKGDNQINENQWSDWNNWNDWSDSH